MSKKGGTGVNWCGTWVGSKGMTKEMTKGIRSMEYLGNGRRYLLVGG